MKKVFNILFISLILLGSGCKEFLDVNDDPNNPTDASVDLILPGAQASLMATFGGSYHNLGGFWAQYYTQAPDAGQYERFDEYNPNADEFDREWTEAYAGGMNDLEVIRTKATEDGNNAYYMIATLLQCYTYQMFADLYDDIPFSEALGGDQNFNPKFDNGSDIYPQLISRIDEAVSRYENGSEGLAPGDRDLIYGGDMQEWIRFANTLKLKIYMRQSYASPNSTAVMDLVNENNFITMDAKFDQFGTEINKRNPFYEIQNDRLGDVNQRASNTMLKYLQDKGDARIDGIYVAGSGGHKAKEQGDFANRDIPNGELSSVNITATTPVYFMMVAEKDFLVAEALVRYASGAGAQAYYESGIERSFAMHGVSGASTLYGVGGPYEWTVSGDVETDIGQIMMQKWIALANFENLEGFFERNRTQYPPLSANAKGTPGEIGEFTLSYASVLSGTNLPRRLLVPDVEVTRNTNAPAQVPNVGLKVWWDQK